MALIFADGFDHWSTIADSGKYQSGTAATTTSNLRFGVGKALASAQQGCVRYFGGAYSQIVVGFAFRLPASPVANGIMFQLKDGATIQLGINVDSSNRLVFSYGGTTSAVGTVIATVPKVLTTQTWYWLEFKAVFSNTTAGSLIVKIEGETLVNVSSVRTAQTANGVMGLDLYAYQGVGTYQYDDLYVLDPTTGTPNDFLGNIRVITRPANSDASVQWTKNTGATNAAAVAEVPQTGDTSYVSDSTVGHTDLYGIAALALTPADIKGVVTTLIARKDNTGDRAIKSVTKSGSSTSESADFYLSAGYLAYQGFFGTDPATGNPWAVAAVDALQFGPKVSV